MPSIRFDILDGYASPVDVSKYTKAKQLMELLEIPVSSYSDTVSIEVLYDFLSDEEKLKRMVSILKNKAFW